MPTKEATRGGSRSDAPNATPEDRKFLDRYGDQLSRTTHRAKWTHSRDEHADRKGQTLATRSGEVIRAWAEARNATPAAATRGPDGRPRVLRFDFDGEGSGRLEHISWDEWLGVFEDRELVFLYQEQRKDGRQSNFFRLDNPKREEA